MAAGKYDDAMAYAQRTYTIVEEQLKTRKLDDEPRLLIALGAAIEVQGLALAGQGNRSEAILYLRRELDTYKHTSLVERISRTSMCSASRARRHFRSRAPNGLARRDRRSRA